jgi:glycosyltransferase involved in cell wall biosynthesis
MKKKLAFISLFPPIKSGIAEYSRDLIFYLKDYYEVYLITNQKNISEDLLNNFKVLNDKEFREKFYLFDRILYNIGNSFHHYWMISLLEEIPGVVILHDVFLGDLINWIDHYYKPKFFEEELYYSHGWSALIRALREKRQKIISDFPLNARVINNALGIIVHSKFALNIIKEFYSLRQDSFFKKINFPYNLRENIEKKSENIENDLIIGSFGFINSNKAPDLIIKGFLKSKVFKNPKSKLFFVGEPVNKEIFLSLKKTIKEYNLTNKIFITGFVNKEEYNSLQEKTFIGIQLRINSRGETSKTLFDLLAKGIPTIVNEHGSFKELPRDIVYFIPEKPSPNDIAQALDDLVNNKHLYLNLSRKAIEYVKKNHNIEEIVEDLVKTLENFYEKSSFLKIFKDAIFLNQGNNCNNVNIGKLVKDIINNYKFPAKNKEIYVDVSAISIEDIGTGIQRVVRAQTIGLLNNPPKGFRIEPIRFAFECGWKPFYARKYTQKLINFKGDIFKDVEVKFKEGSIYYCPDLYYDAVFQAYKKGYFSLMKEKDIKLVFLIYDLLPLQFPEYFPNGIAEKHKRWFEIIISVADLLISISQATADAIKYYAKFLFNIEKLPPIKILHLGADFNKVPNKKDVSNKELNLLEILKHKPYFLMVSTIEPRKGHFQVIKAMELLWQQGLDIHLVLVGRKGWKVDKLINYIEKHPYKGKLLHWLGYVSDYTLEQLYKNALATIIASENEGFGLSIIESAYYKTPVIARDIPVFREIAQNKAFYFSNTKSPYDLAKDLKRWVELYREKKHPKIEQLKWLSWQDHISQLVEIFENLD